LHGESREEAKRILTDYLARDEEERIVAKRIIKEEMNLQDALKLKCVKK
jgi:DNA-nicking Smr family endonuclease